MAISASEWLQWAIVYGVYPPDTGQGSVTEVDTGTGLIGGPITTSGEISFAPIAANSFWANITGSSAAPTVQPLSSFPSSTLPSGEIYVGNGSDVATAVAVSGDATLANTGALTVASIGGEAVSLASTFTTSGAHPLTLTVSNTTNATIPAGTVTLLASGGPLGTPSSGTLTDCTGLPVSTGISGLGTGVATALAINVGTAGAFVVNGGALGTPSSGTATNISGTSGITGLGAQSQTLNMNSHLISNLATPVSAGDAVTKQYADNIAAGFNPIAGAYAASTANLTSWVYNNLGGVGDTLTAPGNGVFSVDGVTPAVNSRFLYKDDSTYSGVANGIWTVTTSTSGSPAVLTRATDYNTANQINPGDLIAVEAGTINGGSSYYETATIVAVGTTAIAFSVFFSPANFISSALISAYILVGNGSNIATGVAMSGDATISNTGAVTITAAPLSAITGLGTGVATALAINVGSAGAPVVFNGAGGTPSSMTATNLTGTAAGLTAGTASAVAVGGITGLGTGVATALAINIGTAGSFITNGGALGTPSSGTLTNCTGLPEAGISASAWSAIGGIGATGFSGSPTISVANYKTIGSTTFVNIQITGTSNATSFSITGLPFNATNNTYFAYTGLNNATSIGVQYGFISGGTNTITLTVSSTSTGWTASGTKAAYLSMFYEST